MKGVKYVNNRRKKEERAYLVKLIEQDKPFKKGYLTLEERDKITILLTENYSIIIQYLKLQKY